MSLRQTIPAVTISPVVPLAGAAAAYVLLCFHMRRQRIARAPFGQFLILFTTYGALLFVLLTGAFWAWSDMASLGAFYLLLGAPFVLFVVAAQLNGLRPLSRYHRAAFYAAVAYLPAWLATLALYFLYLLRWSGGE